MRQGRKRGRILTMYKGDGEEAEKRRKRKEREQYIER
jgi:hypothetical protein